MKKKPYYITTTLPYVNADPHIGFALEIVQADALARSKRLAGHDVFHNFGTDEHGLKIYQKAQESGKTPQAYTDHFAKQFNNLKDALDINFDYFIRTTDPKHYEAAQHFWNLSMENGDIYKKTYKAKYCIGCELEKTDSELVDGFCPLHPGKNLEIIEEENYFFRFSKYQDELLALYDTQKDFVVPKAKLNEIQQFVSSGLKDFSISRLKEKMPWGVPVPNDSDHVMYVWFDALIGYISAIEWPTDEKKFTHWWPGVQVAGKDNLRQQSAIWQAMLLSAGLPASTQIFIHGFISVDGQRMSKTVGNVISPFDLVEQYGTDPTRYYLLAKLHPFEDSDFSYKKFETAYNADLANGLGNLVARVAKLCETSGLTFEETETPRNKQVSSALDDYRFDLAIEHIWNDIKHLDVTLNEEKPWKQEGDKLQKTMLDAVTTIRTIAYNLQPFLPETADRIRKQFAGPTIKTSEPLFPRIT